MTLLAAHRLHDIPVLVGDALCTAPDSKSLKKKIYMITPNLAVGWTGFSITAAAVIGEMRSAFAEQTVTRPDLESFFTSFNCAGMSMTMPGSDSGTALIDAPSNEGRNERRSLFSEGFVAAEPCAERRPATG